MDRELSELLIKNNIFQCRTGMHSHFEIPKTRWINGTIITFEKNTIIEEFTTFAAGKNLFSCGSFSSCASDIGSNVEVGRYTEIATGCRRMGFRHPLESVSTNSALFNFYRENVFSYFEKYEKENGALNKKSVPTPQPQREVIKIGNDVWIGNDVVLSGGIVIGDGAVICSNAVVTKDVPAYSVCGGVPAKVIKYRFPIKICEELIESQWFDYELGDMFRNELDFSSPELFLNKFNAVKQNLSKLKPNRFSPYEYLVKKQNGTDIKNMLITHHNTIVVADLLNLKIAHMFLNKITDGYSPIYAIIKNDKVFLKLNNEQYIKAFIGEKIVISPTECYCDSAYVQNNTISFFNNNQYLSARRDGNIGYVNQINEWEKFIVFDSNTQFFTF